MCCAVDELPDAIDYEYEGAHCHCVRWRRIGAARAVAYDVEALDWAIGYAEANGLESPIFYVLACRMGPFIASRARRIHGFGGALFVNPDGHEHLRSKWSAPVRRYWRASERGMVRAADLLVCDSMAIERYIQTEYADFAPATTYISYGADVAPSALSDDDPSFASWLAENGVRPRGYYLAVGRLVPENNYEAMLREFMASGTERSLVLITSENQRLKDELERCVGYSADPHVRFAGSVYDAELLKKIRENAFAYIHGHEVGGTNPSLLEALASTDLNLLLDVEFNREVAGEAALYWDKGARSLADRIGACERMAGAERAALGARARREVSARYSWGFVTGLYEEAFALR